MDATRSTSKHSQSKHSHTTFVNIDATIQVKPPLIPLPHPSPPREPLEIIRTGAAEPVIKKMAILRTHSAPPITVIRPADALTLQEMTTISIELFLPVQHCSHNDPPALHPHQKKINPDVVTSACVQDDRRCDGFVSQGGGGGSDGGSGGGAVAPGAQSSPVGQEAIIIGLKGILSTTP